MRNRPRSAEDRVIAAGGSVAVLALLGALWSGWNYAQHDDPPASSRGGVPSARTR